MKKYRTDYKLWAFATGVVYLAIWLAVAIFTGPVDFWRKALDLVANPGSVTTDQSAGLLMFGLAFLVLAGMVGWVVESLAIVCGLRRSHRTEQIADYDDATPAPPIP